MFPFRKSIAFRLAAMLVTVTSLVMIVGGALAFWAQYQQLQKRVSEATTVNANQFSQALALPLWNFQATLVDQLLDSLMEDRTAAGIIVRQANIGSPDGIDLFVRTRDVQWHSVNGTPSLQGNEVVETRDIRYQGKVLGSIQVIGSSQSFNSELRTRSAWFLGLILLLDIFLVATLYLFLQKDIIFPIQNIGKFADKVIATDGEAVEAPQGRFYGELNGLRSSIGSMVNLLQDRYAKLKLDERRFKTLIEEGPTAICVVRDSKLLYGNQKFTALFGFQNTDEFAGKSMGQLVAPEVREVVLERNRKRSRGEPVPTEYETIGRRKNGSQFPARVVVSTIDLPDGPAQLAFMTDITEPLKAQDTQRFLASILEQTPDAVLVTDLGGMVIEWNKGAERIFGYSAQEALGKFGFLEEPGDQPGELDGRRKALRAGKDLEQYETVRKRKDGQLIHLSVSASVLKDHSGKPMGYAAIYRDITEQRKAQENQRFLASILEQTPDAVVAADRNSIIIQWNEGAERIFGFTAAEAIGRPHDLMVPEHLREESARKRKALLAGERAMFQETVRTRKDGRAIHVSISAGPLLDPSGKVIGFSAIYRDITDQMKARENQRLLAHVLEQSPDAIVAADTEERIIQWNQGAEKMFGWTAQEVLGKPLGFFVPDHLAAEGAQYRKALLQGLRISGRETLRKTKDGRLIPVSVSAGPLQDPSGKIFGASAIFRDITEQVKARETQRLLASILEQTPDGVVLSDPDGIILQWNKGAEDIYGYTAGEAIGRPGQFLEAPGHEGHIDDIRQRLLDGENDVRYEVTRRRKDGTLVDVAVTRFSLKNDAGKVAGFASIIRDITDKRKAERSKNRLASVLEQSADSIAMIDMEGRYTDVNHSAEVLFGFKKEEVLGKTPPFIDLQAWKQLLGKVREADEKGQGAYHYETQRTLMDGRVIDLESTASVLKDEKGEPTGFSFIVRDITDKKKADEVRNQLAAILQQTPDAVAGADLNGNIYSWNKGAEDMFGYKPEEILGKHIAILVPPDRMEEQRVIRKTILEGGEVRDLETVRLRKDGTLVDVSLSLSLVRDSNGKVIGNSAILRDISERKKTEESLRQQEERMRRMEKMDAIGRLAGGVAHDFNNLLSVIGGNAEFLKSTLKKGDPSQEEVTEIQKAVQRGSDLTKQMLVFSKKQSTQPQPLDLGQSIVDIHKMLSRTLDANIEISVQSDKDLKLVQADPSQVHQAVMNLALNARDAMPNGGHLVLETRNIPAEKLGREGRQDLPPGDYVRLKVTDTGTGMSPETQKHVFEPFFTTKGEKGTGLGLANVFGIVANSNGFIYLDSAVGRGTTFTLYFPVLNGAEAVGTTEKESLSTPGGTETILLAEDEEALRKLLVRALGKQGYQVLETENGTQAILKAMEHKGPIHLLLTDVIMPKMNGKELADEIARSRPRTKVLYISGYPREVLSQQNIQDPNIRLIQKPFPMEELLRMVRNILDGA